MKLNKVLRSLLIAIPVLSPIPPAPLVTFYTEVHSVHK